MCPTVKDAGSPSAVYQDENTLSGLTIQHNSPPLCELGYYAVPLASNHYILSEASTAKEQSDPPFAVFPFLQNGEEDRKTLKVCHHMGLKYRPLSCTCVDRLHKKAGRCYSLPISVARSNVHTD